MSQMKKGLGDELSHVIVMSTIVCELSSNQPKICWAAIHHKENHIFAAQQNSGCCFFPLKCIFLEKKVGRRKL